MSTDGQGTKCHRIIAENFNRLSRMHERYRQTYRKTDVRATAYSEREREFNQSINQSFAMAPPSDFQGRLTIKIAMKNAVNKIQCHWE